MARSVTIKDVAQRAEVSIATVSRILNNQGNTREEIRQRVLQAAADLGYFKSSGQSSLARNNKQTIKEIGFLLAHGDLDEPAVSNTFWAQILQGAESEARKSNIYLTYRAIPLSQAPYHLLNMLREMGAGGLLLVGPVDPETVQPLQAAHIPLVLVDNYIRGLQEPIDAVVANNLEGTREALSYLISLGHRRIAFLGGHTASGPLLNTIYTFEQRREGYLLALREAGLSVHSRLMEHCIVNNPESIRAACQRLIRDNIPFTALFCVNDATALHAIKELQEQGVRIPEDISIVGFDDIDMAKHLTPPLTTVRVHKEAMGATAVRRLIARVADPQAIGSTSVLEVELVKRASVLPSRADQFSQLK